VHVGNLMHVGILIRFGAATLAQPLCAHNWFKECGVGLSFILGFGQCD